MFPLFISSGPVKKKLFVFFFKKSLHISKNKLIITAYELLFIVSVDIFNWFWTFKSLKQCALILTKQQHNTNIEMNEMKWSEAVMHQTVFKKISYFLILGKTNLKTCDTCMWIDNVCTLQGIWTNQRATFSLIFTKQSRSVQLIDSFHYKKLGHHPSHSTLIWCLKHGVKTQQASE